MESRSLPENAKTAIITGLSPAFPGLTATTIALATSKEYDQFALIGRDLSHLEAVSTTLKSHVPDLKTTICHVEVMSTESWAKAAHEIRSQLGAWSLFVHAVDGFLSSPVQMTIRGADEDLWWSTFESRVRSLHHVVRHFMPKMSARAHLVNLTISNIWNESGASALHASTSAANEVIYNLESENQGKGSDFKTFSISTADLHENLAYKILNHPKTLLS